MSATAALYGIRAAAGLGQGIFGLSQMSEAKRREEALRAQGLPQMSTPQEYFDLYQNASRSRQFEEEKAATQSILAANLATLEAAGSRAVIGGAPAAQITAQRGIASAASRDFNRQQQALGQLAAAQQRTEQLNYQARANQYARDLLTAQAGYQAGAETMIGGFSDAIGAGILAADKIEDRRAVKRAEKLKPEGEVPDPLEIIGTDTGAQERGLVTGGPSAGPARFAGAMDYYQRLEDLRQQQLDFDRSLFGSSQAEFDEGYHLGNPNIPPRRNAQGGSVTTPGKYTADHSVEYDVKTKDGKTIATVTGDETLVFNPQQRKFLKKVIGKLMNGQTIKPSKAETKTANQTLKAFKK